MSQGVSGPKWGGRGTWGQTARGLVGLYSKCFRVLASYYCVTNHLNMERFKTEHIFYLTVSVGQESGHAFTVSFTSGLSQAAFKLLVGLVGWLEDHVVVGKIQFLPG